jgi:hypothetical protein
MLGHVCMLSSTRNSIARDEMRANPARTSGIDETMLSLSLTRSCLLRESAATPVLPSAHAGRRLAWCTHAQTSRTSILTCSKMVSMQLAAAVSYICSSRVNKSHAVTYACATVCLQGTLCDVSGVRHAIPLSRGVFGKLLASLKSFWSLALSTRKAQMLCDTSMSTFSPL